MRRMLSLVPFLAVVAVAAVPAAAAPPDVPACALGRLDATTRHAVERSLGQAQERFGATLPTADRARGERLFSTAAAAYVYGYPEVVLRRTIARYPVNRIIAVAHVADASTISIVAPNHDTLYSVGRIDLSGGPVVVTVPDARARYSVLQFLDQFTNSFAYLGSGDPLEGGGQALLAPPGWTGTPPAGMTVVRSPSRLVWLLGRTLVDGPGDVAAARPLLAGYGVASLADAEQGRTGAASVLEDFPAAREAVALPSGLAFFDALGADLAGDPPPAADACAIAAFAEAGIGAGRTPSTSTDALAVRALSAAAEAGPRLVAGWQRALTSGSRRGWSEAGRDVGTYGTAYVPRAVVATVGLGANTRREALYPITDRDSAGRPLDGAHRYEVRFAPGQLPPVQAFWSLTLYDSQLRLSADAQGRYAVGDRTPGLRRGRDGSLTITVSRERPAGVPLANWLPAPAGRFHLYLRLYQPRASAVAGRWAPPRIIRVH